MSINPYLLKANPYLTGHSSIPSWYQQHNKELESFSAAGDQSGRSATGTISAPAPPQAGQGYNSGTMFGGLGTLASAVTGIPGLGAIGAGFGVSRDQSRANDELSQMGLNPGVSFGPAIANAATFGMLGNSVQGQFNNAAMGVDPDVFTSLMGRMNPVMQQRIAQGYTGSTNFHDIINDMNNVGRLSEIFGSIDAGQSGGGGGYSSSDQAAAESGGYQGSGMY